MYYKKVTSMHTILINIHCIAYVLANCMYMWGGGGNSPTIGQYTMNQFTSMQFRCWTTYTLQNVAV